MRIFLFSFAICIAMFTDCSKESLAAEAGPNGLGAVVLSKTKGESTLLVTLSREAVPERPAGKETIKVDAGEITVTTVGKGLVKQTFDLWLRTGKTNERLWQKSLEYLPLLHIDGSFNVFDAQRGDKTTAVVVLDHPNVTLEIVDNTGKSKPTIVPLFECQGFEIHEARVLENDGGWSVLFTMRGTVWLGEWAETWRVKDGKATRVWKQERTKSSDPGASADPKVEPKK